MEGTGNRKSVTLFDWFQVTDALVTFFGCLSHEEAERSISNNRINMTRFCVAGGGEKGTR